MGQWYLFQLHQPAIHTGCIDRLYTHIIYNQKNAHGMDNQLVKPADVALLKLILVGQQGYEMAPAADM